MLETRLLMSAKEFLDLTVFFNQHFEGSLLDE
jgi:hypothetical protein